MIVMDVLADSSAIVLDQREAVVRALMRWRYGSADYTDYLSLELALGAGARELLSFDKQLLRGADVRRPG